MNERSASWHPLCLSTAIEPSTSAGAKLHGKELVVWRDGAGVAHVWEDRCPHRGMRLSLGFVRGDRLACLYHGWQYDGSGQCRFIPAHPNLDVPATITVPTFRTREWAGIIWASLEENSTVSDSTENFEATPVRSIYVDLPLEAAVAALSRLGIGEDTAVKQIESNISLVKGDDRQWIAAFQPVADDRTALHFVLCGTAPAETLRQHAQEIEMLRHRMEAGALAHV